MRHPPRRSPSRHRLTTVLALAGALVLACQDDETRIAELLQQGRDYAEEGEHASAIIEYRTLLQLDPNHAEAHHQLAEAYLRTQQPLEAIWEYSEAVRLDPSNTDAQLTLGGLLLMRRDWAEAEDLGRRLVESDPQDARGYAVLGQALAGLDKPDEAERMLLKAVELDPETTQFLMLLATFHDATGNREAAEPVFMKVSEMDPSAESYTALGRFFTVDPARDAEARAALETALKLSEGNERATTYRNLANLHWGRERRELAIQLLEEGIGALDGEPDLQVEMLFQLAGFHAQLGDEEAAEHAIIRASDIQPDRARPHMVLARLRNERGDHEGALEALDRAAGGEAGRRPLLARAELLIDDAIARGLTAGAEVEEGAAIVEEALAAEPTNPLAHYVKAKIALARQDPETAIEAAREALNVRESWPTAHLFLGQALAESGDINAARGEVARAVELDPTLVEARLVLASLHAHLGEHEYAIEQARIYLAANPEVVEARVLLAQSLARLGRIDEALDELPEGESAGVSFARGRLLLAIGRVEEARDSLLRANRQSPNHPAVLRFLLNSDTRLGTLDEAGARIEAAIKAEPKNGELARLMGTYALRKGDPTTARTWFERAIELDPRNVMAYEQLATLQRNTGQLQETIAIYREAIAKQPDSARLHHQLATLLEAHGQIEDAMAGYEKAIALDAGMAQSKNNLAYLLADSGSDLDRALDLAQEAKALMPDSASAADTLGWVLYRRGIPGAAVGYLREAIAGMEQGSPEIGVVRHHLALAYEANDQVDLAIEALEQSLEDLAAHQERVRAEGGSPEEPVWSGEAQAMLERLKSAG